MMYMSDAIRATINIMQSPAEKIKLRSSYNIAGVSFSPKEIATEIQKHIPDFKMDYEPDSRQKIADSWPQSINDTIASQHWNWGAEYNLSKLCTTMLTNLEQNLLEENKIKK